MSKKCYSYEETHRTVKGVKHKLCVKCNKWKGKSEFRREPARKDGLRRLCRECDRARERAIYRKDKKHVRERLRYEESHRTFRGVKQKLCSLCKEWIDESHFHRDRRSRDGLDPRCKECKSKYVRKRYERIGKPGRKTLRYEDRHRVVKGVKKKLCTKCRRWKKESGFYKDNSTRDGLMGRCKKCSYKATSKSRKK